MHCTRVVKRAAVSALLFRAPVKDLALPLDIEMSTATSEEPKHDAFILIIGGELPIRTTAARAAGVSLRASPPNNVCSHSGAGRCDADGTSPCSPRSLACAQSPDSTAPLQPVARSPFAPARYNYRRRAIGRHHGAIRHLFGLCEQLLHIRLICASARVF